MSGIVVRRCYSGAVSIVAIRAESVFVPSESTYGPVYPDGGVLCLMVEVVELVKASAAIAMISASLWNDAYWQFSLCRSGRGALAGYTPRRLVHFRFRSLS